MVRDPAEAGSRVRVEGDRWIAERDGESDREDDGRQPVTRDEGSQAVEALSDGMIR